MWSEIIRYEEVQSYSNPSDTRKQAYAPVHAPTDAAEAGWRLFDVHDLLVAVGIVAVLWLQQRTQIAHAVLQVGGRLSCRYIYLCICIYEYGIICVPATVVL